MFIATLPVLILHLFLVPAMAQGFLSCGVEKCLDRGTWYGCPAYHRPCICQKDMHYIEEFLDKIRPCVEHNANCTEGGMHEYMNGLQLICAEFGHQISSMPSQIRTFLNESLASGSSTFFSTQSTVSTAPSSISPSTTSTSSTSSTATSTTPSATVFSTPTLTGTLGDDEKDNGLSVGATVGIVLGAGLGGTALAGLLFFWWRKKPSEDNNKGTECKLARA